VISSSYKTGEKQSERGVVSKGKGKRESRQAKRTNVVVEEV